MNASNILRQVKVNDYVLTTWDTGYTDSMGKSRVGYQLAKQDDVVFDGEDFCCSPLNSVDSDETYGRIARSFNRRLSAMLVWSKRKHCARKGSRIRTSRNRSEQLGAKFINGSTQRIISEPGRAKLPAMGVLGY